MNWKLRIMNRTTWAGILAALVACAWQVMGVLGVVPPVSEDTVVQAVGIVLNILVGLGVLVDPTTAGVRDSARAMGYDQPWDDGMDEGGDD